MTGLGRALFLLWMFLLQLQTTNCNFYGDILWGQCHAFCLTRLEHWAEKDDTQTAPVKVTIKMKDCRKNKICKWCLIACQRPKNEYLDFESCLSTCDKIRKRGKGRKAQQACEDSCEFIKMSSKSKYGMCPAEENLTGLSGFCTEQCKKDLECDRMDKCCSNGCGRVCHSPTQLNVFPPKPGSLVFKVHRDGSVLVRWDHESNGTHVTPVIYILRYFCQRRSGVTYSVVTIPRVKVKGLRPAARCNFMVAATNVHGSLGFSELRPYRKKLLKPSSPLNLEVVRQKLHGDNKNKVDLSIRWQPPRFLDGLPLERYLILWSEPVPRASPEYQRLHINKKTVRAERNSYTIPNLKPGTTYFVQVKAMVLWDGRKLNGHPESIYTETVSTPQSAGLDNERTSQEEKEPATNIYNITVEEAIFIRSQLTARVTWSVNPNSNVEKYMLYWIPDICDGEAQHRKTRERLTMEATTHKQEFTLYKLKSNCLYELRLHTVSYYGEKDSGRRHLFQTLPCHETKGSKGAKCPPKVTPPPTPLNLSVRFKLSACMCQAVIKWAWPTPGKAPHQSIITWGLSQKPSDSHLRTIVYQTIPFKMHIPGNDTEACVNYLTPLRHYTVQVTSSANKLHSSPAILHFVTPIHMAQCNITTLGHIPPEKAKETTAESNIQASQDYNADSSGTTIYNIKPYLWVLLLLVTAFSVMMR